MTVEFEKFSHVVRRYALAITRNYEIAEDLAQETMLRAVRNQDKFAEIENRQKWLFTVLTNLWRDRLRQKKRQPLQQKLTIQLAADVDDPQKNAEQAEELAQVLESFQDLPNIQRQVLYLRTVEGFSIDEVSKTLNISRGNVKTNLSIARKTMRTKHLKQVSNTQT